MQLYCCAGAEKIPTFVNPRVGANDCFTCRAYVLRLIFFEMQYQRVASGFLRKLFVILLVCVPAFAFAQEDEKESAFYGTVDLASQYIWRGTDYGDFPSIMPTVGFYKGGFDVYAWGNWAFDNSYSEVNIGLSYSFSNFTVELVDYFYPGVGSDFFNFRNSSTTHSVEAIATYAPEVFPLHVTLSTAIYGDDKKENGKNAFSTYAEIGYSHEFNEKNSVSAVVGASVGKGYYTDYEKNFSIVNIAAGYTRVFTLWDYDLPASATVVYNPYMERFLWSVGLSFSIF